MTDQSSIEPRNYAGEIGVNSMTLATAKLAVQLAWHDGHVPLLIGESGTGKTAAIGQLARMNDMDMIPQHLGNMDSTDVRGPMFPQEGGTFKFLTPGRIPVRWEPSLRQRRIINRLEKQGYEVDDILEDDFDESNLNDFTPADLDVVFSIRRDVEKENRKAALFFDEGNRCTKDAMNAVMPVWTEGRLGDAIIGPNVRVCAAMNPPGGVYAVNQQFSQDPAMRRRVCQLVVHFSHSEFMRYAEDPKKQAETDLIPPIDYGELENRDPYRPYHYSVISYLRQQPDTVMDVKSREAGKVYGCPPTWEAVSDTMYTVERLELNMDDPRIRQAVKAKLGGHVGKSATSDFLQHYEKATESIEPEELLYQYKENTPTWHKVQRKIKCGEHLGLTKVAEASVRMIFDPKDEDFDVDEVIPQFARLVNDLPTNLAQDLMTYCSQASDEVHGGQTSVIRELMASLMQNKNFLEFQKRTLETAKEYQDQQADVLHKD